MQLLDFEKSRKEVLAVLAGKVNTVIAIKVVEALKKATIEAEPVRHGRWEPHPHAYGFERCSVCHDCNIWGEWADGKKWRYCPNCGAKMDGGGDDDQA